MAVRNFDGAGDSLHVALGGCDLTGAFTVAVLFKLNALGLWHSLIANHASAGTTTVALEVSDANQLHLTDGGTDLTMTATLVTGRWYLGVGRKAAGSAAGRVSLYDFTAGSWTHQTLGSLANAGSLAGGTVRFGQWQGTDDLNGRLALAAEWTTDLSDPQLLALETGRATSNWLGLTPAGLWELNQASTATAVTDLTGNGANQSALAGTTAVGGDDPPGWTFTAGGLTRSVNDALGVTDNVLLTGNRVITINDALGLDDQVIPLDPLAGVSPAAVARWQQRVDAGLELARNNELAAYQFQAGVDGSCAIFPTFDLSTELVGSNQIVTADRRMQKWLDESGIPRI